MQAIRDNLTLIRKIIMKEHEERDREYLLQEIVSDVNYNDCKMLLDLRKCSTRTLALLHNSTTRNSSILVKLRFSKYL